MRLGFALLFLLVLLQPASAQDCSHLLDRQQRADCERTQSLFQDCARLPPGPSRLACLRGAIAPAEAARIECTKQPRTSDKMACMQANIDALRRELKELRRQIPALIEEQLKAAMEPRLHK